MPRKPALWVWVFPVRLRSFQLQLFAPGVVMLCATQPAFILLALRDFHRLEVSKDYQTSDRSWSWRASNHLIDFPKGANLISQLIVFGRIWFTVQWQHFKDINFPMWHQEASLARECGSTFVGEHRVPQNIQLCGQGGWFLKLCAFNLPDGRSFSFLAQYHIHDGTCALLWFKVAVSKLYFLFNPLRVQPWPNM